MSQYKTIDGKRYEKDIIQHAEYATTLQKHDAVVLYNLALDGGRITDTEKESLFYIMQHYKITDEASALLKKLILKHK